MGRFELPTYWFVARHSIQLSYIPAIYSVTIARHLGRGLPSILNLNCSRQYVRVAGMGRFELPTYWFVARHSIQLSYIPAIYSVTIARYLGRVLPSILNLNYSRQYVLVAGMGRFELPTYWFVARHSIQLSYIPALYAPSFEAARGCICLHPHKVKLFLTFFSKKTFQ